MQCIGQTITNSVVRARDSMDLVIANVAGSGKTTLTNVLTATITRTCGHVTLNGEPLDRRWRRKMAYVMQKDAFYASLTLRETLTVKLLA